MLIFLNRNISLLLMSAAVLILYNAPLPLSATENAADNDIDTESVSTTDDFEYIMDGRKDPFSPFISKKKGIDQDGGGDTIVEDGDRVLTGLQLIEPGNLKLVGIIATPRGPVAMAEDVTGKGYVLHEGVLIGRHGRIETIQDNQVMITETAKTRSGRTITKEVVMRLEKRDK